MVLLKQAAAVFFSVVNVSPMLLVTEDEKLTFLATDVFLDLTLPTLVIVKLSRGHGEGDTFMGKLRNDL